MRNPTGIDVNDPDYDDPIVAEVRTAREEFGAQFEDVAAMARYLRECERRHPPGKVVSLPIRRQRKGVTMVRAADP